MDQAEWGACGDPEAMIRHLGSSAGDRKLRLFAAACCRRVWPLLADQRSRDAVTAAEQVEAGTASEEGRRVALRDAQAACVAWSRRYSFTDPRCFATRAAYQVISRTNLSVPHAARCTAEALAVGGGCRHPSHLTGHPRYLAERASQAAILRDVFGDPFSPAALEPACRTSTARSLAQAAYEHRTIPGGHLDNDRLAVLADALEEAGCEDAMLLAHLRSAGPHFLGCFAVDAVLGLG